MLLTREAVSLTIALLTFFGGMMVFVWKVSATVSKIENELKQSIAEARHESVLRDEKHERLADKQDLLSNGYKEKFEHIYTRLKNENAEISKRLNDVEQYLAAKTQYQRRG